MIDKILATLLWLQPHASDRGEPSELRAERLREVAIAIDQAAPSNELRAALITVAFAESHFAAYVLEGRCHEGKPWGATCDTDPRTGEPRALGIWQLHQSACKEAWDGGGLPAQARCAVRILTYGRHVCRDWPGAFSVYAGRRCDQGSRYQLRAATMARILRRL